MKTKRTPGGLFALANEHGGIRTFTIRAVAEERLRHLEEEGAKGFVSNKYPYIIYITSLKTE